MANKIERFKNKVAQNYLIVDEAKLDKMLKDHEKDLSFVRRELSSLERTSARIDKLAVKSLTSFCKSINSTKSNYMKIYNSVVNAKVKTKKKLDKLAKKGKTDPILAKDLTRIEEAEAILADIASKRQGILQLIHDIDGLALLDQQIKKAKTELKQLTLQVKTKEKLAKLPFNKSANAELEKLRRQKDSCSDKLEKLLFRRSQCHYLINKTLGGDFNSFLQEYLKQLAEIEKRFTNDKSDTKISVVTSTNIQMAVSALRISANMSLTKVAQEQRDFNLVSDVNLGVDVKDNDKYPAYVREQEEQARLAEEQRQAEEQRRQEEQVRFAEEQARLAEEQQRLAEEKARFAQQQQAQVHRQPNPQSGMMPAGTFMSPTPIFSDDADEEVKNLSERLQVSEDLIKEMKMNLALDLFDYSVIADFINKHNCNGKEKEIINLFGLAEMGGISDETLDTLLKTMTHPKLEINKSIVTIPKTYKQFAKEYGISEEYAYEIYRVGRSDIAYVANKIISKSMTLDEAKEYIDLFKEVSELKGRDASAKPNQKAKKAPTKAAKAKNSTKAKSAPTAARTQSEPKKDEVIEQPIKTEVLGTDVNDKAPVEAAAVIEAPVDTATLDKENVSIFEQPVIAEQPIAAQEPTASMQPEAAPAMDLPPIEAPTPVAEAAPIIEQPVQTEGPVIESPAFYEPTDVNDLPVAEEQASEPILFVADESENKPFVSDENVVETKEVEPPTLESIQAGEGPIKPVAVTPVEPVAAEPEMPILPGIEAVPAPKPEESTPTADEPVQSSPAVDVRPENVSKVKEVISMPIEGFKKCVGKVKAIIQYHSIDAHVDSSDMSRGGRN